jgi:hypothetical protein
MEYLIINFFLVFQYGGYIWIGETFVDGQNRDVWCNSKETITDLTMYYRLKQFTDPSFAAFPSCYALYFSGGDFTLVVFERHVCFPSYEIGGKHFLCE